MFNTTPLKGFYACYVYFATRIAPAVIETLYDTVAKIIGKKTRTSVRAKVIKRDKTPFIIDNNNFEILDLKPDIIPIISEF
ncbi:hypothetical protein TR67_02935 [Pseudomonas deceptionensis]|nr:hypothetical protein TR67_02935 [Pseudomonas deceptionensis]